MIYSVWNQSAKAYDYYQNADRQNGANTPTANHLRQTKLGLTVEQAAWPLPAGSRKLGSGPFAKGRIAGTRSGMGLGAFDDSSVKIGLLVLSAFLVWKFVR